MIDIRLFLRNICMTIISISACALIGLIISYVVGAIFYHEAFMFRLNGGSIGGDRLRDYDQMQSNVIWLGAASGLLAAQSLFLVKYLGVRSNAA